MSTGTATSSRRRHPRLTPCPRANEHLTYCVLHRQASLAPNIPSAVRANHRLAAKAHAHSVIHHLRLHKHKHRASLAKKARAVTR